MKKFGLEPIRIKIEKYEEKLKTSSLSIKQQKEILQELKARPYRFTYDETLESPVDFVLKYGAMNGRYSKTLTVELDNRQIIIFKMMTVEYVPR